MPRCDRFRPCTGWSRSSSREVVAFDLAIPAQVFGREPERYAGACARRAPGACPTETGFDVVVPHGLEALGDRRHGDRARASATGPGRCRRSRWRRCAPPPRAAPASPRSAPARSCSPPPACSTAAAPPRTGATPSGWRASSRPSTVDPGVLYVDEGDVLTSAGVGGGHRPLPAPRPARPRRRGRRTRVARRMVVAAHRDGGQAQFVERPLPDAAGGGLARTRAWMEGRLGEPLTVAAMARHAGYEPALVRPPLPRRDRHDAAAVADRAGASRRRSGCSREPTCRWRTSPRAPASAPPSGCASTSPARSGRRRPATAGRSARRRSMEGMPPELWTCHLGTVEYRAAAALQEQLRERVIAGELPPLLLLLEHPRRLHARPRARSRATCRSARTTGARRASTSSTPRAAGS